MTPDLGPTNVGQGVYHFNDEEAREFLRAHQYDPKVYNYVNYIGARPEPPWGIVVQDGNAKVLVWYDDSFRLHVIDVTAKQNLANAIEEAEYQTPLEAAAAELVLAVKENALGTGKKLESLLQLASVLGTIYVAARALDLLEG